MSKRSITYRTLFAILASAISIAAALRASHKSVIQFFWPGELRGVLEINSIADTTASLIVGYNYYLLERYAKERDQKIEIILAERNLSYIDSLNRGNVDIVVFPYGTDFDTDSLAVSAPIDSSSVWLLSHRHKGLLHDVDSWIEEWHNCGEYEEVRDSYLKRFDIFKSRRRSTISPYDDLIKTYSDSIGCDWRFMAAIIYSESRFHIEAKSRRGARGLMQMMPHTAKSFGANDPLNPEVNIAAGANLIGSLFRRYYRVGANREEVMKFVLAGYNAGVGRISDCIKYAEYREVDPSYWENIVEIIPEMSAEDIMDTGVISVGPFKGTETIAYVDHVLDIYRQMCYVCPKTEQ